MSTNTKTEVLSPLPGVFYRKPSPDKDVYVEDGGAVKAGDIIGLIEVMKNFFEVKAEVDGIVHFKITNEDMVEAGQEIATITAE